MKFTSKVEESSSKLSSAESITRDERWKLALRVAGSAEFSRSARLRGFLLYVCEKTLAHAVDEIHEQQIGSAVFGRKPDYNYNEDNIVRVEARELRRRLDRYFAGEGRTERLRIRIPKGSYVALFEPQIASDWEGKNSAPGEGKKTEKNKDVIEAKGRSVTLVIILLALLVLILLMKSFISPVHQGAASITQRPSRTTSNVFWPLLFNSNRPTNIVVSDCPLLIVESRIRKSIPLKQYMGRRYLSELNSSVVPSVADNKWTSLANAIIIARIVKAVARYPATIRIRYPRDLSVRDLEQCNLVFLGSSYSDPWIGEFNAHMDFVARLIPSRGTLGYENRSPLPGEQHWYDAYGTEGRSDVTYGVVSFLPNLQDSGNVLILEGTTTEGTEAAGDFMTNPGLATRLRKSLNLKTGDPVPYFQLLLKTTILGGAPAKMKAVAHRIISAP